MYAFPNREVGFLLQHGRRFFWKKFENCDTIRRKKGVWSLGLHGVRAHTPTDHHSLSITTHFTSSTC